MADFVSKKTRARIMSRIGSKNTKLETKFRRRVSSVGLKYRLHYNITGKPDFVFVSKRIAVFVDSCFWHGCKKHFRQPSSNKKYWIQKIERNSKRDKEVAKKLKQDGWNVLRFWEHEINRNPERCVRKILKAYETAPSSNKRRKPPRRLPRSITLRR